MAFIIHGDGDYLYHDSGGLPRRADEEALVRAMIVAVQNPLAEVFIFHERPGKRALLFFPLRDGKMYYYRHGRLQTKVSYRRAQGSSRFDSEERLYRRFRAEGRQSVNLFFYFGHEIPEFGGARYDASYPRRTFTVHDLADGLKGFTGDSTKFDLIVLSTCFNGTPHTIAELAPYARTVVASPENLHLSYFDLHPFERLDAGLRDGDTAGFARRFARLAFDRLTENVQTAVTVAVYDMERVRGYLKSIDGTIARSLTEMNGQRPESYERCDCAEDSAYALPGMSEGVEVFYRPPLFGRLKHKQNHSGWECFRLLK
jgi:hypothetical protein